MKNQNFEVKDFVKELSFEELEKFFFNKKEQLHYCPSYLVKEISDELYLISLELEKRIKNGVLE